MTIWYYAVAKGQKTGVFTKWSDAEKHVIKYKGARFKKFSTEAEAWEFIRTNTGERSINSSDADTSDLPSPTRVLPPPPDYLARIFEVYTDGSCINNGKPNAKAGIGIFYGEDDGRNRAENLIEGPQTNQRAELWAVIRAIQSAAPSLSALDSLVIWTDSAYVQKGITEWIIKWQKNNWKTSTGGSVQNMELWKELKDEIEQANCCIKFKKVLGHSGDVGNEGADYLANLGAASVLQPYVNAYNFMPSA